MVIASCGGEDTGADLGVDDLVKEEEDVSEDALAARCTVAPAEVEVGRAVSIAARTLPAGRPVRVILRHRSGGAVERTVTTDASGRARARLVAATAGGFTVDVRAQRDGRLLARCGGRASVQTCALTARGPIVASADGQVIENVRIVADGRPGVQVGGRSNVIIRNVEIHHRGAPGIQFWEAPGLRIEDAVIVHDGAPPSGPNDSDELSNIDGDASPDITIDRVRLLRGSSGIYLHRCPRARLSNIEGHDFRGPLPRGQLVQLDASSSTVLEDFSSENGAASWPEDIISVYRSSNVVIRRGLIDGDNSPTGVGVMFELSDIRSTGGLVEDVDAVRMGNGAFSAYPGKNVTFRRTRVRDNRCGDQGRGAPTSRGLVYAGSPGSSGLRIESSTVYRLCDPENDVWQRARFDLIDLRTREFVPRAPLDLDFCWIAPRD